MDRRQLIGLTALGLGLGAAGASLADTTVATIQPDDMVLGSPKAKVTVIEYASASCPHCARFDKEVFPAFKAKYIDTGRVHYAFREFLTPPVQFAAAAFLLARCAGKGQYFGVVDAVFRAQDEIYSTGELRSHLQAIGKAHGVDDKAFEACFADTQALAALNERVQRYSTRDGVNVTPTFLVNGKRLEGEQSLADLDAAVAAAETARR
jgi:protein-disulfide isomerase